MTEEQMEAQLRARWTQGLVIHDVRGQWFVDLDEGPGGPTIGDGDTRREALEQALTFNERRGWT
jgi:hypothetical protein